MAAKKRARRSISTAMKVAAVEEVRAGAKVGAVLAKYNIVGSMLANWRHQHASGVLQKKLNGQLKGTLKGNGNGHAAEHVPLEGMTPEKLFNSRVQKAIITLRDAWKQVKEMEAAGKLAEPDTAHLLANLALKYLQGDYGR